MRAKEFIRESLGPQNMAKDQVGSIPNAHYFPDLDNSSGYMAYRWGVALAGMPDYPMPQDGTTGQKLVTIGYTEADDLIIDSTSKLFGARKIRLTPRGSTELKDTNKTSPVANWMGKEKNND
jgi:hypothetical protein